MRWLLILGITTTALATAALVNPAFSQEGKQPLKAGDIEREKLYLAGWDPDEPVPAYAADWAEASNSETLADAAARHLTAIAVADIRSGDLLLFRWRTGFAAKHAAIATAPDLMVHAHDGAAVAEVAIAPWWRRRLAFAFRFPGVTD